MQLIREHMERAPMGSVFSKVDFDGYGSDDAIRMALSRLVQEGLCERLLPSVYFRLGDVPVAPDACDVGMAIARNYGWKVVLGPALARQTLGIGGPAEGPVGLTSTGPSRVYQLPACGEIYFRQSRARFLREMSFDSAMVVNALLGLKKDGIMEDDLREIGKRLSAAQKKLLLAEKVMAPKWMARYLEYIAHH